MERLRAALEERVAKLNEHPEGLTGLEALFELALSGEGGGSYWLRLTGGRAELVTGADLPPTARVSLAAGDFWALLEGRTSALSLFLSGKVRLEGDVGQALRLQALLR
jgi:putative sterol carrier protein